MMALHPETVRLDLLPPKGEPLIGVGGVMDPRDSSAAFGNETIDLAVDIAVKETLHRLENRSKYLRHGHSFREGLWKQK